MRCLLPHLLLAFFVMSLSFNAHAALISRGITIDGNMNDWLDPTSSYNPPGSIPTNAGQYSTDCNGTSSQLSDWGCDRDANGGVLQSTGRDLKHFSYTWDNNYLYFYVERFESSTNVTDWWFYVDSNADGLMQTGEKVVRVTWKGNNRQTDVTLNNYNQNAAGGDVLVSPVTGHADGYTMPGSVSWVRNLYTAAGGSVNGVIMEARVAWSSLGAGGPTQMGFHVSSSNGANIPSSIIDNMDGPGGGQQLFPSNLMITKSASINSTLSLVDFTYTLTLSNTGYNTMNNIVVSDVLPGMIIYRSHSVSSGSFSDSNADGTPDSWSVVTLASQQSVTLQITVQGRNTASATSVGNTATISSWTGTDLDSVDNSASVSVTLLPAPELQMTKVSSSVSAAPLQPIGYTIRLSNIGGSIATNVVLNDHLSNFTAFRLDTFGAGLPFLLTDGSPASGLTLGAAQYSSDNGSTFAYVPVSGGGGAPAGYDANVTDWRIPLPGEMNDTGANLQLRYEVMLR